ncbi:MAG: gfo/Idh/MocA family oxidoreductase [Chloroflexia bacterium]|nr:gfo/Idh/MocA family oxidoreductase [Chloroflexia bacterium]
MIRIGIVGCGRILNAHLQGYLRLRELGMDDFRITALCARNPNDALMFRRRGEGPPPRPPVVDPASGDALAAPHTYVSDIHDGDVAVFTDYHVMIASGLVDAVNDFTTLAVHHDVAHATLQAGKHLLTQKPLAISVRAGRKMVDLAAQRQLTLGVFENVRQMELVRAQHWAVARGLIGTPQFAVLGSLGGLWSPQRIVAETPWRHQKLTGGGGGSIDIGVHQMDWMRYVMGEVRDVSAMATTFVPERTHTNPDGSVLRVTADVDDTYMATVRFESNAMGQLWWSWAGQYDAVTIDGGPAFVGTTAAIRGDQLVHGDGRRESLLARFQRDMTAQERQQFFPHGLTDPAAISQYDWLQAIVQGSDPETSGREGLRDLAAAYAILESSLLGRRVAVADVMDGTVASYQHDIDVHYRLLD